MIFALLEPVFPLVLSTLPESQADRSSDDAYDGQ